MQVHPRLRRELIVWRVLGLLCVLSGAFAISQNLRALIVIAASSLFIIVGLYLMIKAYPFHRSLSQLASGGLAHEMLVQPYLDAEGHQRIELRFPDTDVTQPADIDVEVLDEPWLAAIAPKTKVEVYGVHGKGPVVVKTESGLIFPSGPGATRRRRTSSVGAS